MAQAAQSGSARRRLEVRVSEEQNAIIRQAAEAQDTTVTAFLLETVTARARKVVRDQQDLVLSSAAFTRFLAELDKPAEVVPELVELFSRNPRIPEL
ncbi:MAG: DUF1778 domain-containing protein [Solirubrobacteraceae bacterium]